MATQSYDFAYHNHTHTTDDITDVGATGADVMAAATAADARTAIGAGTSNLQIGTTATTAKAGNWTDTSRLLVDSNGALTRFRGVLSADPTTDLRAGDWWALKP